MAQFAIFLLDLIRCEDFDVDEHLSQWEGLVVPFVPQRNPSQTIPYIGKPHSSLSDYHLVAKFVSLGK